MKILIRMPFGKVIRLKVDISDTIDMVKAKIEVKESILPHQQCLIFAGMLLEDGCTLANYNISEDCCLQLVPIKNMVKSRTQGFHDHEGETSVWWEKYALCLNEIQTQSRYREDFDSEVLDRYIKDLAQPNMFYDQHVALCGLKALLKHEPEPVGRRKGSFVDELDKGLKCAIKLYQEAIRSGNDMGPFIIHPDVPFLAFEDWYKMQESCWRISFQFTDAEGGVALLYGDPSLLHEAIAGWFTGVLVEQTTLLIQAPTTPMLDLIGSSMIILPSRSHKEPDFAVQPKGSKWRIPPFVGEVAYANESLSVLQGELVQWTIQGGAQIAYGVKLSLVKNETESKVRLRFLERREGYHTFTQDLDFSPEYCTRAGDPDFVVRFPLEAIFGSTHQDQRLLRGFVLFDLFQLQQTVLGLLENHSVDCVWQRRQARNGDISPLLDKMKIIKKKSKGIFNRIFKQ